MKTPREILLQRHRAAAPQLDAIREAVVRELNPPAATPAPVPVHLVSWFRDGASTLWRELFWSCRRTWAGLAAVWLGLLVFNALQTGPAAPVLAQAAPAADVRLAFLEQQKLLAELAGPRLPVPAVEPPRRQEKPRSESQPIIMTV
jgi:hypothetical protein